MRRSFSPTCSEPSARCIRKLKVDVVCDNSNELIREVANRNLDLALVARSPGGTDGELIRTERLCWVAANENSACQQQPLPLALFPNECVCRDAAVRALHEAGLEWRIAFTSSTIAPILATVAAGFAVTVMEECVIPRARDGSAARTAYLLWGRSTSCFAKRRA